MDMEQLKTVLAVVQQKTFLDAAEELHCSQSSVSKNIQRLENELGVQIFERTTRRVSLTEAGQDIVAYSRQMLDCYEGLLHVAEQHRTRTRSRLRIGSIYFGLNNRLVPLVAKFMALHPTMEVSMEESTTTPLLHMLEQRELDVIFVSSMYLQNGPKKNFSDNPRFLSFSFSIDPYFVVVGKGHPLSGKEMLSYEDLAEEKLITTDKTMDVYHRAIDSTFSAHGVNLQIAMHCTNVRSVLHMVSQNVGIAILSQLVVEESDDLELIPLQNPLVRDTQMLILNDKKVPPHISAFFHFIRTGI